MKTFTIEGQEVTIPNISATSSESNTPRFRIDEGEYQGVEFLITNIRMDESDETLMWYDLTTWPDGQLDKIKPLVDNFIISILTEQIERLKDENPPAE